VWATVAPASFTLVLVPFEDAGGHLLDDYAAANLAIGAALALALDRRHRRPLLVVALIYTAAHAVSHLVGIGGSSDATVAWAESLLLIASTAVLVWLVARSGRADVG